MMTYNNTKFTDSSVDYLPRTLNNLNVDIGFLTIVQTIQPEKYTIQNR